LDAPKSFEVLHRTNGSTGSSDLGLTHSTGDDEIYTQVEVLQLAQPTPEGVDLVASVQSFATLSAPPGWIECDGREISRSLYARLFQRIGDRFGTGDGTTTFNVPDMRGEFIRGWDNGRGVDGGRGLGTGQADQMQGHGHVIRERQGLEGDGGTGFGATDPTGSLNYTGIVNEPSDDGVNGAPRTGPETRPRNIAMLYCIKY
ncbi:MAG: phage tail protein, partial [Leptospirales bacterium]